MSRNQFIVESFEQFSYQGLFFYNTFYATLKMISYVTVRSKLFYTHLRRILLLKAHWVNLDKVTDTRLQNYICNLLECLTSLHSVIVAGVIPHD